MRYASFASLGLGLAIVLAGGCSTSHTSTATDASTDRSGDSSPPVYAGQRPPGAWDCDDPRCRTGCCTDPVERSRYCCEADTSVVTDSGIQYFCGDGPPCINQFYCCAGVEELCPGTLVARCFDGRDAYGCGRYPNTPGTPNPGEPGYCETLPYPDASVMP